MKKLLCGIVVLLILAGVQGPSAGGERESLPVDEDERLLESAGLSSEGPGLLAFFRARARTEAETGRVEELVRRLCSSSHEERIQAGAELVALGPLAVPGLRRVANDIGDPEVRDWARRCLAWVEGPDKGSVAVAAIRLVAKRRPAGAVEALLAYLPHADNEDVIREIGAALQAVALNEDKLDQALLQALSDPLPLRRAVAGAALSQAAPNDNQAAEKLLKDGNPEVRLTAALALAKAHNAAAIPVLIDLVAVLPVAKRGKVEELLQELAGEWAPVGGPTAEDEIGRKIRRDAWVAWWANTDGPALISLLGKHTLTPAEQAKVKDAIRRLGDKVYSVREKAVVELVASGRRILPMLRDGLKDTGDLEVVRRLERCIQQIENEPANRLPSAALRLLALRKPAGAAEALLAYFPFAETDHVDEITSALTVVASRDGKPDPALIKALAATRSDVRLAAAEALAQGGGADGRAAVRKLLSDDNLALRMRVGLALAPKDAEAIPVLIELIGKVRDEQAGQIHDFLRPLAGEKAPEAPEDSAKAREKCSAAWAAWWEANSAKTDLAKLTRPHHERLGYTVVAEYSTGKVVELGRDRKVRWSFAGTASPTDAWVLPNNKVIVCEYGGNRVTSRDLKGNILWTKQMNGQPFNIQVLHNGNVFIASNVQIAEVDRNGKDVNLGLKDVNIQQLINQIGSLTGGYKTRNGQFILMGQNGTCLRLDANGKQLKSFQTNRNNAWLDVTPNGRIIMATNGGNKLAEYDAEGKMLLELDVQQVSMVTGLPNGNFLVCANGLGTVVEMDRRGKVLWEYRTNGPFRARGR